MADHVADIRQVLERFQGYYTQRDPALIDGLMELMAEDLEVIGTNASRPGAEEWYLDRESAREIFLGDWESWGDVRLDVPGARIHAGGETAWLSATATVSMTIRAEKNYSDYLEFVRRYIESSPASAEEKLLYLLRGGANTLYELRRGENFVWPLRFTAVLTRMHEGWKFVHMQFSFPTTYFPDVRIT